MSASAPPVCRPGKSGGRKVPVRPARCEAPADRVEGRPAVGVLAKLGKIGRHRVSISTSTCHRLRLLRGCRSRLTGREDPGAEAYRYGHSELEHMLAKEQTILITIKQIEPTSMKAEHLVGEPRRCTSLQRVEHPAGLPEESRLPAEVPQPPTTQNKSPSRRASMTYQPPATRTRPYSHVMATIRASVAYSEPATTRRYRQTGPPTTQERQPKRENEDGLGSCSRSTSPINRRLPGQIPQGLLINSFGGSTIMNARVLLSRLN